MRRDDATSAAHVADHVAAVAGCGEADDGGAADTPAGKPITLSVGVDSVYAPTFLAAAEDLFADEGIRAELRQFAQELGAKLLTEQDPEAAAEATEEAANVEPEQAVKAVDDLIFEVRDLNERELERLDDVGAFLRERGIVETRPPVDEIFSPDASYVP